jgi:hypothetical protein
VFAQPQRVNYILKDIIDHTTGLKSKPSDGAPEWMIEFLDEFVRFQLKPTLSACWEYFTSSIPNGPASNDATDDQLLAYTFRGIQMFLCKCWLNFVEAREGIWCNGLSELQKYEALGLAGDCKFELILRDE